MSLSGEIVIVDKLTPHIERNEASHNDVTPQGQRVTENLLF